MTTTTTIIYHDTEKLAKGVRRPRAGETIAYRSIKDWDEKKNENFKEVIDLSTKVKPKAMKTNEL